jgi:hypothetical protein
MTIIGAISAIDALKPNTYNNAEKIRWLSVLDGMVKREIIDTHEDNSKVKYNPYTESTSLTTELLVPHPYDDMYIKWLEAQIDYANGEYGKYNNTITMYNVAYSNYEKYYNRTHMPIGKSWSHF